MVDYLGLYQSCVLVNDARSLLQLDTICCTAISNQSLYQVVSNVVKVTWPVIAAIHFRESNQNFMRHLHNGDPLSARTLHAPMGRPTTGSPPFTWPESAIDAFGGLWRPQGWDIANCLRFTEMYNGTGYQKHGINTPYLWDFTDKYTSGLFIADGSFDPDTREVRPGAVSILKTLAFKGISLDFSSLVMPGLMLH